jgi:hypothetical protein
MWITAQRLSELVERHLPVVFDNPNFCILVGGMAVFMGALYALTRHKGALIVAAASLLYFVPFVRF